MEIAVLGLGCFWGPEIKFSKIDGIIRTEEKVVYLLLHVNNVRKSRKFLAG